MPFRQVLVVDEEKYILEVFFLIFGKNIHYAESVSSAIKVLEKSPVKLIISDYKIGRETGAEILRFIKESNYEADFHYLTACRAADIHQETGIHSFNKPDDFSSVVKLIEKFAH